ncbi:MAG: EAL domain-containing protein [Hyphomicrobiales bacterium]|nr:MAG: EAL domain-containing protein [Hyphomicrobiales bacterium]
MRLSQLRPYNRRHQHLRIAATTFDRLVSDFEGAVFTMYNDDLVVITNGASIADIDRPILHLRVLFSEDPLIMTDEKGYLPFCDWYDLTETYEDLLRLANEMVQDRAAHDAEAAKASIAPGSKPPLPTTPLDPASLAVIESAIAQADLSTMICRQPICAVSVDRQPEPIFYEIYTSIESLRRTLMPDVNIHANFWLFQDLTRHLDRRMIAYLAHNDDGMLHRAFSLNLNVATLLSPEFLAFDKVHNNGRRSIVIEVQLTDIFADLGAYLFARDFLHERGYRFCLDGMTHLALPLVDRERLGFDLVKVFWTPDLVDHLSGRAGDTLKEAARRLGPERLILARCDSEHALEIGDSLGIALYQGWLLEEMLKRRITRMRSIQALADALARHRAATRR